jgi:hypothetical protein
MNAERCSREEALPADGSSLRIPDEILAAVQIAGLKLRMALKPR